MCVTCLLQLYVYISYSIHIHFFEMLFGALSRMKMFDVDMQEIIYIYLSTYNLVLFETTKQKRICTTQRERQTDILLFLTVMFLLLFSSSMFLFLLTKNINLLLYFVIVIAVCNNNRLQFHILLFTFGSPGPPLFIHNL